LRVHFHIPLFSERLLLPELSGSQEALAQTFDYLSDHVEFHPVLEVETYSWGVLPAQLRPTTTLAQLEGIVAELHWVEDQLRQRGLLHAYSREAYADAF
ncbi:sugar phosphate isomerase/epimerase, partial [Corynebacterium pseudodiphtheriticum]